MLEKMKWESVYELWKMGCYYSPKVLTEPVSTEAIFVEYKQNGYIYGYDWLEATDIVDRLSRHLEKGTPEKAAVSYLQMVKNGCPLNL